MIVALLSAGIFAAGLMIIHAAPQPAGLSDLISGYRSWHKVNPVPINMSAQVSMLCIGPPSWNTPPNPHDPKFFTVYVNPIGERAMLAAGTTRFPSGAVIVKEKLASRKATTPELLTVMVKRDKGFDSKNGDWEYFTADGGAKRTSQDNKALCQSCHAKDKDDDFVFRSYVVVAKQPKRWP